ncbi:hypothetical protein MPQ_1266 [Methylovorus sp. MP688]|nr:hypothetical protein MPQ_1266 [Methylovorus sp. MP688]
MLTPFESQHNRPDDPLQDGSIVIAYKNSHFALFTDCQPTLCEIKPGARSLTGFLDVNARVVEPM